MTIGTPESTEQFAIETREHLDEMEAILLRAEWEPPNKEAIAALFRGYHSIKGLARLLDLHGLETLAHYSENLLAEIRAERLAFEPAIQSMLIETLDAARSLRERAIAGDGDASPQAALLAALDRATKNARNEPGGASAMIDSPDPHDAPLYDDREMLIYFAEMLAEFLPDLAGLAGGDGDPMRAGEGIDTLMIGTERLQLKGMHSRFEALLASEETLAIYRLAAVIADARRFGRLIGRDTGADALVAAIAEPLRRAQAGAARRLLTKLPHDADSARAEVERLVSLTAAGVPDGGIAVLVLQALAEPANLEAASAAVTLLANDASDDSVATGSAVASLQASLRAGEAPKSMAEDTGGGDAVSQQLRVPVELLDKLFGRLGEFFGISGALNALVADSQIPIVLQRLADYAAAKAPDHAPAIQILQRQQKNLADIEAEVRRLISQIHAATLGLRVIPLDTLFNRFPRMVRDLAKAQGKAIRFEARTDGIKLDKGMIELLGDPLMHMLRNAVSHGVESTEERAASDKPRLAAIRLNATQNGNRIAIEIADDGRGIDTERVRQRAVSQGLVTEAESQRLLQNQIHRFIFSPGFSTAEQVTGISGRGVGMDVALVNVSRMGGRIDIRSIPGQGTTFQLDLPLTAAIVTVLLAETAVQTLAFPERMVVQSATVGREAIQYVNGQRSILLHDRLLPIFRAAELLRLPGPPGIHRGGDLSIIVAAVGSSRYGIEVDRVLRRHELLIRETHPRIAQLPGIGGVATLGSDRIVLVVDPEGLTQLSRQAAVPGLRSTTRAVIS